MLDKFERLKEKNPGIELKLVSDQAFSVYGEVHQTEGLSELNTLTKELFVDESGTSYIASSEALEATSAMHSICRDLFAEFPLQAGCCYGMNTKLNGMEYHKSSEIISAATDIVLMLGRLQDVDPQEGWDSSLTEFFYVPEGTLLELYATTLHLAPCRTDRHPFSAVIVLPKGTNTPLEQGTEHTRWMKNKWMLAHPEGPAAARGAAVMIRGENCEISTLDE